MTTDRTLKTGSRHSEKDIDDELAAMMGDDPLELTLGHVVRLYQIRSPYVMGGAVTQYDMDMARGIVPAPGKWSYNHFHDELIMSIGTAWRAFEIVADSQDMAPKGRQPKVDLFSPEWLADTVAAATQSLPSLTWHGALWELPLAAVLHLALSTYRRNGGITERPADIQAALNQLKELKDNGENHA